MAERPLYTILEVTSTSTPAEIKKAYYQKALQYHPDKIGPQGTEKFTQIQAAYDVLSDPSKRAIYDKYGEQGLSRLGSAPDIAGLSELAGAAATTTVVFGLGTLGLIILLIFLSFLCVKIEDRVEWHWAAVFIPAYILCLILTLFAFGGILFAVRGLIPKRWNQQDLPPPPIDYLSRISSLLSLVALVGMVAFTILVSVGLEKREDGDAVDWWKYFIPLFVGEGLWLLATLVGAPRTRDVLMRQGLMTVSSANIIGLVLISVITKCCRIAVSFLICARVTGDITVSWWVVFIPFYVWYGNAVIGSAYLASVRRASSQDLPPDQQPSPCSSFFSSMISMGLPLASVLMIAAKIEGNGMPLEECFIPIFIVIGSGICLCCCLSVVVMAVSKTMADDVAAATEQAEEQQGQQQDATGNGADDQPYRSKAVDGYANGAQSKPADALSGQPLNLRID